MIRFHCGSEKFVVGGVAVVQGGHVDGRLFPYPFSALAWVFAVRRGGSLHRSEESVLDFGHGIPFLVGGFCSCLLRCFELMHRGRRRWRHGSDGSSLQPTGALRRTWWRYRPFPPGPPAGPGRRRRGGRGPLPLPYAGRGSLSRSCRDAPSLT